MTNSLINILSSDFCGSVSGLRIFSLIGYILSFISIIVPIIIILLGSIDLVKALIANKDSKKHIMMFVKRLIYSACIFFIYPLISMVMGMITNNDYTNNPCMYCLKNSKECGEKAEQLQKQLSEERKNKIQEKEKQLTKKQKEKSEKYKGIIKELEEKIASMDVEQTVQAAENESGYTNETRTLVVKNGNFYLPNVRATSDEHTPKGTGEYGLNQEFWNMLSKLIQDGKSKGYSITVTDGWRPYSRQKQTWLTAAHKCNTNWVACPGGSGHGFGIAADLAYNGNSCSQGNWDCNAAAKWVHDNAASYGLNFRLSNEPWHIEPTNRYGGNFGACTAPCS